MRTTLSLFAASAAACLLCLACGAPSEAANPGESYRNEPSGGGDTTSTGDGDTVDGVGDGVDEATGGDTGTGDDDDGGSTAPCGTFPTASDLSTAGPFGATSAAAGPSCTIVRPALLGQGGVRHPVVVWGNGTGAPVSLYKPAFELWASHGVIVAAANATSGQGSGTQMLDCLAYVLEQSGTANSPYENKVCARAAASGHSQGAAGALMAGRDARVLTTAPLQPYIQQGYGGFDQASIPDQRGPMLLLSGTADDNAVPTTNQQPVFDSTNVPVFWGSLIGGDHYTVAFGLPTYRVPMLAWFRLHLLGDESFRGMFYGPECALCVDGAWSVQRRGIE